MSTIQPIQYVIVADQPAPKEKTNHILHLILTIITGGLWAIVWLLCCETTHHKNRRVKRDNARLRQVALSQTTRQIEGQIVAPVGKMSRDYRTLTILTLVAGLGTFAMIHGVKNESSVAPVASIVETARVPAPPMVETPPKVWNPKLATVADSVAVPVVSRAPMIETDQDVIPSSEMDNVHQAAAYIGLYAGHCSGEVPANTKVMIGSIYHKWEDQVNAQVTMINKKRETIGNGLFCNLVRKQFAKYL